MVVFCVVGDGMLIAICFFDAYPAERLHITTHMHPHDGVDCGSVEGACTREPVTLATAVVAGTREVFMDRICGGGLGLVGGWRSPCVTVTVMGEGM